MRRSAGSLGAEVMARLKEDYKARVVPALTKEFGYKNPMQVPSISKIVINMGVGEASQNRKEIEGALADMTAIAGQKPVMTRARKSIANFKLRDGMIVGCRVTLRGDRMWEFLDRLVNIALPRIRDFKGVSPNSFDGRGNYTLGVKEQIIFPEIDYDKIDKVRGMDITICTTANTNDEGRALLKQFNMPFHN
jgi:large subunit ribosomal protein L5